MKGFKEMSKITKKQKKLQELLADFQQPATGRDALTKLQEVSKEVAKFNETVECHMRLGIEVKHAEQQIRSTVVLPAGLGKEVRVCVIAKGPKVNEAKDAGADFYGTEEIIDKISQKFHFFIRIWVPHSHHTFFFKEKDVQEKLKYININIFPRSDLIPINFNTKKII